MRGNPIRDRMKLFPTQREHRVNPRRQHGRQPRGEQAYSVEWSMPNADLSKLWEEHTKHEFVTRDTEATLATMVEDAYVNHVPVMTGGAGKAALREFYSRHFIPSMPPDTLLTPISRTVGEDQIVDEMIFSFTHTQEMPWMLPGIAPTHRRVEVALVAIVRFRDGKLRHEHIYWDQASVLKQIGLLTDPSLPVCGAEAARKVAAGA
jgi:carboxymethylenebutenolidase